MAARPEMPQHGACVTRSAPPPPLNVLIVAPRADDAEDVRAPLLAMGTGWRVTLTTALVEAAPAAAWHDAVVLVHAAPEAARALRAGMTARSVDIPLLLLRPETEKGSTPPADTSGGPDAVLVRDGLGTWRSALPALVARLAARHADRIARDEAEASLTRQRALFEGFMRHSPAIAYLKDPDGKYQWVNATFERFFDLDEDEWRGRTDIDIWGEEAGAKLRENDLAVLAAGDALEVEDVVPMEDGPHHWLAYKFPWRDPSGGNLLGGMAVDVTPLRHADDERRRMQARLEQARRLESLGSLASNFAHEFNRILAGILADAGRARLDVAPGSEGARALDQVEQSALRAADLTHHLLALTGRASLLLEPVSLRRFVEVRAFALKSLLPAGARIHLQLGDDVPEVLADIAQFDEVLTSLVGRSAASLLPGGSVTLRTHLADLDEDALAALLLGESVAAGQVAVLDIEDDGPVPENLATLLEPKFGASPEEPSGLSAVLGFMRGHGGAVGVEARAEGGVRVRLVLPLAPEASEDEALTGPSRPARSTVLIVDDEEPVRARARAALQRSGWNALVARDGEEALGILSELGDEVSAVLLDTTMPGLSGFEVLRRMKQMNPQVKVVLTSKLGRQDVLEPAASNGAEGFLPKPHRPRRLVSKIREIVEGKES